MEAPANGSLLRSPSAAARPGRRRYGIRSLRWFEQRDRDLPESRGGGQAPVKCDYVRTSGLRKSYQVTVGYRLRGRLEGKGPRGLPEQSLGAARLGRELHARVPGPPVVQLERPGQGSRAAAHHLPIGEQAQESQHGEPAEQQRRIVDGGVPAGGGDVLRVFIPGQRQPNVDVNQV